MTQTTEELQALIADCSYATLSDSQTLYPNHAGDALPLIRIKSPLCKAVIALHGAHLLSFAPKGTDELLWLSPECRFTNGGALRGGIPLCLPWFGEHPIDTSKPKHGFARNQSWTLTGISAEASGETILEFTLIHDANKLFNSNLIAKIKFILGCKATLQLQLENTGQTDFSSTWVMHSYFAVADLDRVRVRGLAGREYSDKTQGNTRFTQTGELQFIGEVDRVFEGIDNPVAIIDGTRHINITHSGCPSVVTWNPGAALAVSIGDIGPGNERGYVCVERGACGNDAWHLAPGDIQEASMTLAHD